MTALTNVRAWLEARGRAYPKADADGSIPADRFTEANLPMVVECTNCRMTMALTAERPITEAGCVYCEDCAEALS